MLTWRRCARGSTRCCGTGCGRARRETAGPPTCPRPPGPPTAPGPCCRSFPCRLAPPGPWVAFPALPGVCYRTWCYQMLTCTVFHKCLSIGGLYQHGELSATSWTAQQRLPTALKASAASLRLQSRAGRRVPQLARLLLNATQTATNPRDRVLCHWQNSHRKGADGVCLAAPPGAGGAGAGGRRGGRARVGPGGHRRAGGRAQRRRGAADVGAREPERARARRAPGRARGLPAAPGRLVFQVPPFTQTLNT